MASTKNGGKRIGYIRVSTVDQNEGRQSEALGNLCLDKLFIEKTSGKDTKRPQLQAVLDYVREGDTVIICSMDRLARNMRDLQNLVADLNARDVAVEFIKEGLTFTGEDSPISKLMLSVLGGIAEFERSLILERQREGIAIAKAKGIYTGRKRALTTDQVVRIRERVAAGESKSSLALHFGVSRETVYQCLRNSYQTDRDRHVPGV